MNAPNQPQPLPYLKSATARPIASEESYVVLCRPLSNGAYVLEYVERSAEGKLITAVAVHPGRAAQ
ncbi:MAG: hypothetical protein GF331_04365 [Chitinivibrionales bacterium]|nr:hypothetical protein [Chitinivibrionales bacterium]